MQKQKSKKHHPSGGNSKRGSHLKEKNNPPAKVDILGEIIHKIEKENAKISARFPATRDFVKKNEFFFQASGILILAILFIDCLLLVVKLNNLSALAANLSEKAVSASYAQKIVEEEFLISKAQAAGEGNAISVTQNFNPSAAIALDPPKINSVSVAGAGLGGKVVSAQAKKIAPSPARERSCKGDDKPHKSGTKGNHVDEDCCPDPDEWPKPGCVYSAEDYKIMLKGPIPANKKHD